MPFIVFHDLEVTEVCKSVILKTRVEVPGALFPALS